MTLELIKSEALKLKRREQLALIQAMLNEIAREEADMDKVAEAQVKESERRIRLFRDGKMETVPAEKAVADIMLKHGL